jgi:hypothetical protein
VKTPVTDSPSRSSVLTALAAVSAASVPALADVADTSEPDPIFALIDAARLGDEEYAVLETMPCTRAGLVAQLMFAAEYLSDEYPWSRPKFGPFAAISKERICHYDEFSHDRCNGHFAGFACANELIVFCLKTGIASRCDQSWHVDGPP